jgi:hypothetical protein
MENQNDTVAILEELETKKKMFLKDNPVIIDVDSDYFKTIKGFIDRLRRSVDVHYNTLSEDTIAVLFSGPRVNDMRGFEPYSQMSDMFSFFFALIDRLYPHKETYRELWKIIDDVIVPLCGVTNSLYDSVIRAIDTYKPDFVNTEVMFNILSNVGKSKDSYCNMAVFDEYVPIESMGQLLNNSISNTYRTEIIYNEMIKGLRSDKIVGIPAADIVSFFLNQKDSIILNNFDINMLIINIYINLYNVHTLDKYTDMQLKNLELHYQYAQGKKDEKIENQDELRKRFAGQLNEHYVNLQTILHRLISLRTNSNNNLELDDVLVLAYILVHVPPEPFFVRSSYDKVFETFVSQYDAEKEQQSNKFVKYKCWVKPIIKLNPNIDIPLQLMEKLFDKDDLYEIIE